MVTLRRFYWPVAITAYWLCALWVLFWVTPVSIAGSGPSLTLYWGGYPPHHPSPTLAEYDRNTNIRFKFLYPYLIIATILTFLGCGFAIWFARPGSPGHSHLFLVSCAATLFSLLLLSALSDVGVALHIWWGPMMYTDKYHALPFLKIIVPMSLFAGLLALGRSCVLNEPLSPPIS